MDRPVAISVIILNVVVLYIMYDRAARATSNSEPFVANVSDGVSTPPSAAKERVVLYVYFPENETRFKHVGGFPTHYCHLIFNAMTKLIELKETYPQLDRIVVRVPSTFPNTPFLTYVERILPFVRMDTSDDSSREYHNIYTFVTPYVRKQDLRRLHVYAMEMFPYERIGQGESERYVILVMRNQDKHVPGTNGSARRSISNMTTVTRVLEDFLRTRGMRLRMVELETMDIIEQIALFQNASGVVAQHGAALANTVWCRKCQLVMEFTSHNNMYFKVHGFHQFADEWFVQNYGTNHLNVDIHGLSQMLKATKLARVA